MTRTQLEHAVELLATARGYHFVVAHDRDLPQAVTIYPAAALTPPELIATEGRKHGRRSYKTILRLLYPAAKLPLEEQPAVYAELEGELLSLMAELSEDEAVIAVEELTIRPAANSLTPHGEISQSATAHIITCF